MSDFDFVEGEVLLFNKPKEWTSFDVVKKIRGAGKIKKIGHAGTLDPLATGLLILCTGRKTKTITSIQELPKTYVVQGQLGAVTKSYDAEHPPEDPRPFKHISRTDLEEAIKAFTGDIKQYPPLYSAVKIDGKRAYKSARAGKEVELRPRFVSVYKFDVHELNSDGTFTATIQCSKGTYIRSLVHDLGQALETGAYIKELKRTAIGDFLLENAWEIDEFAALLRRED